MARLPYGTRNPSMSMNIPNECGIGSIRNSWPPGEIKKPQTKGHAKKCLAFIGRAFRVIQEGQNRAGDDEARTKPGNEGDSDSASQYARPPPISATGCNSGRPPGIQRAAARSRSQRGWDSALA